MNTVWNRLLTVVLGALFAVCFVAFMAGILIRRDLLVPALYTSALADNDVYERLYTDVFSDPALQQGLADTLGIQSNLLAGETYAELISVFNLILPPPRMQNAAEQFFVGLTDYVAARSPQLAPELPLNEVADPHVLAQRISDALVVAAVQSSTRAMQAGGPPASNEPLSEDQLLAYLDSASAGHIEAMPLSLLRMSAATLSPQQQDALVDKMLEPVTREVDDATRRQMKAALVENDLVSAVVTAVRARLADRIATGAARLEERLGGSKALNAVEQAANTLDTTGESLIAGLNLVRGYATAIQSLLVLLAILLAVLLGAIVWLHRSNLRSMLLAAGWTLAVAGGLVLLAWLAGGFWLRSTLLEALASNPGLPAGLDGIVDDVVGALTRTIWEAFWRTAMLFFGGGVLLIVFAYTRQLVDSLGRLLAPLRAYTGWVVGTALGVLVLIPLLVWFFSPNVRTARLACNGHVGLCDRPANEVAYAASHNAMSISNYGWLWPSHDGTIADQLDAGVRALLIDTHYGDTEETLAAALKELPPEAQAVAREAIEAGNLASQKQAAFLCHIACGLGSRVFTDTLNEIAAFMAANPREVLFVIIQDAVSPADTAAAFASAGLERYIYDHPADAPWPTLGEMIGTGNRLVVMAEEDGPPPSWYQNVWDSTMETPYKFINYGDFSCAANRGGDDKPFFLLNHWIQRGSPNRVDATIVNDYDFLLRRARQCEAERGKMPNFIAVNFYQNGDVFRVVDTLNNVTRNAK